MQRHGNRVVPHALLISFFCEGKVLFKLGIVRITAESCFASLLDGVPERPSIECYIRIVRDAANRRRAAKLTEKAQQILDDPSIPTTALATIGTDLAEIAAGRDSLPPRFSEDALALRFSRKYAHNWRYVHGWGKWMGWDGMRWVEDSTLHVFDLARGICREASADCGDSEKLIAAKLASSRGTPGCG